jgi:hypothetical protein
MKKIISLLLIFGGAFGLSAKKSPNVLYIISDDQAWTDYGLWDIHRSRRPVSINWPRRVSSLNAGMYPLLCADLRSLLDQWPVRS